MKAWQHFKTITHHKWLVLQGCFRVGLYWQGITHDLSKYMPTEFMVGVRYFQGNRSPNAAERWAAKPAAMVPRCISFSLEIVSFVSITYPSCSSQLRG